MVAKVLTRQPVVNNSKPSTSVYSTDTFDACFDTFDQLISQQRPDNIGGGFDSFIDSLDLTTDSLGPLDTFIEDKLQDRLTDALFSGIDIKSVGAQQKNRRLSLPDVPSISPNDNPESILVPNNLFSTNRHNGSKGGRRLKKRKSSDILVEEGGNVARETTVVSVDTNLITKRTKVTPPASPSLTSSDGRTKADMVPMGFLNEPPTGSIKTVASSFLNSLVSKPQKGFRKKRGGYKCSMCGKPKRNHKCKYSGTLRFKKKLSVPMTTIGTQCELDPFGTIAYMRTEEKILRLMRSKQITRPDYEWLVTQCKCIVEKSSSN